MSKIGKKCAVFLVKLLIAVGLVMWLFKKNEQSFGSVSNIEMNAFKTSAVESVEPSFNAKIR